MKGSDIVVVRVFSNNRLYNVGWQYVNNKKQIKCKSGCIAPSGKEFVMAENHLAEVIVENGIRARVEEVVVNEIL